MRDIGYKKGIEQGEKNKQIEIAKRMLLKNIPIKEISEITQLSIEEISELQ